MMFFKKRWFYITNLCLALLWAGFIFWFYHFYADAIDFGIGETSVVMKVLLITKYRGEILGALLISGFLLITISAYNLLVFYFKLKSQPVQNKKDKISFLSCSLILLLLVLCISFNIFGIIWLAITILSLAIVYFSYVIAKNTIGDKIKINEEVIGVHGPFPNQKELEEYIEDLRQYNNLSNLKEEVFEEENEWFVSYIN